MIIYWLDLYLAGGSSLDGKRAWKHINAPSMSCYYWQFTRVISRMLMVNLLWSHLRTTSFTDYSSEGSRVVHFSCYPLHCLIAEPSRASAVFSLVASVLGSDFVDFVISSFATRFVTSDHSDVCLCSVRILRSYHCLWYYKYYNFVQHAIDTQAMWNVCTAARQRGMLHLEIVTFRLMTEMTLEPGEDVPICAGQALLL